MLNKNNIIVKDTWIMPAPNEETTLTLQEPSDLLVGCWLWNPSVGYLEVTKYSGYDIYVTVKNLKMEENAREGSVFPGCMEMLVIAPNATPILDNNVTCLSADFISPEEGSTALMKVVDSSAIKAADLIIVDNKYQYVVIQVIDEHTLEVLNEGKGAEGIIKIDCTGCVSVKIFESTYCCKVLQEEVDDIYDTLNNRHSIKAWTGNNLVTISGGNDSLIAPYDVTVKVDNDLSKYDNSVSKFSSLLYFKESAFSISNIASFYPDRSTGMGSYQLGTTQDYYDYAYIRQIIGPSTTQYLRMSGIATTLSGTSYVHFNVNGGGFITLSGTSMSPAYNISSGTISLGTSSKSWSNVYTDKITLNGTTYTSIPSPANNGKLTIYNSDGETEFLTFTADQAGNTTATLPAAPSPVTYTAVSPIYIDSSNNIGITRYFEEVKVGDHYFFQPIIDPDALSYNLGASSDYFDNAYIRTTYTESIKRSGSYSYINLPIADSTFYFNCDQSTSHSSNFAFSFGSTSTIEFEIYDDKIITKDIIPYSNSTPDCDIGTTSYPYRTIYCTEICTARIRRQGGGNPYLSVTYNDVSPSTTGFQLGYNIRYGVIHTQQLLCTDNSGATTTGTNIGTNNNKFYDGYFTNINGVLYNPSDKNNKEEIKEREKVNSLDLIKNISTYEYNYKDDENKIPHIGIMAQDLKKESPTLVVDKGEKNEKGEGEESLYIDVMGYVTLLTEAIKELAQDVAELKKTFIKGDEDDNKEISKEG